MSRETASAKTRRSPPPCLAPAGRGEQARPAGELRGDLAGGQCVDPARRNLDGQRESAHRPADLGDRGELGGAGVEPDSRPAGRGEKEPDRIPAGRVRGLRPARRLQSAHLEHPLFREAEPLSRAGDRLDVGGLGQEAGEERPVVEPPLETVEDEQEPGLAKGGDHPGGRVVQVPPLELEGPGQGHPESRSPLRLGRGNEDDAVREGLRAGGQA